MPNNMMKAAIYMAHPEKEWKNPSATAVIATVGTRSPMTAANTAISNVRPLQRFETRGVSIISSR